MPLTLFCSLITCICVVLPNYSQVKLLEEITLTKLILEVCKVTRIEGYVPILFTPISSTPVWSAVTGNHHQVLSSILPYSLLLLLS